MLLLSGRIIKDATGSSVQKYNKFTVVSVFICMSFVCMFVQAARGFRNQCDGFITFNPKQSYVFNELLLNYKHDLRHVVTITRVQQIKMVHHNFQNGAETQLYYGSP